MLILSLPGFKQMQQPFKNEIWSIAYIRVPPELGKWTASRSGTMPVDMAGIDIMTIGAEL